MNADHLDLLARVAHEQAERERWASVLSPARVPGADCCEYGVCEQNPGCPVRAARPPVSIPRHDDPAANLPFDWLDELRYWALACVVTAVCTAALALLLGYLSRR